MANKGVKEFFKNCFELLGDKKSLDHTCSLPRWWVQEIKSMYVSRFSHTCFIYNLNTISIRCEHTCTVMYMPTALSLKSLYWLIPPPCFPLCPLSALCISEPPLLLTWRSLFWWSWCECPSTLVPGWWWTAHPLILNSPPPPPPPLPATP